MTQDIHCVLLRVRVAVSTYHVADLNGIRYPHDVRVRVHRGDVLPSDVHDRVHDHARARAHDHARDRDVHAHAVANTCRADFRDDARSRCGDSRCDDPGARTYRMACGGVVRMCRLAYGGHCRARDLRGDRARDDHAHDRRCDDDRVHDRRRCGDGGLVARTCLTVCDGVAVGSCLKEAVRIVQ